MHKVELSHLLSPQRGKDALIRNPMMDMLHTISEQGSISKAARALELSTAMSGVRSGTGSRRSAAA